MITSQKFKTLSIRHCDFNTVTMDAGVSPALVAGLTTYRSQKGLSIRGGPPAIISAMVRLTFGYRWRLPFSSSDSSSATRARRSVRFILGASFSPAYLACTISWQRKQPGNCRLCPVGPGHGRRYAVQTADHQPVGIEGAQAILVQRAQELGPLAPGEQDAALRQGSAWPGR